MLLDTQIALYRAELAVKDRQILALQRHRAALESSNRELIDRKWWKWWGRP